MVEFGGGGGLGEAVVLERLENLILGL